MNKKDKIIILKARIIELERELKKAERTCAKQDNEIDMLKETIRSHVENNQIVAQVLMDKNKAERESKYDDAIDSLDIALKYGISKLLEENKENFLKLEVSSLTEKYKPIEPKQRFENESTPIESTKELFEGKGYVFRIFPFNIKGYADGIENDGIKTFTEQRDKAKPYRNLNEFFEDYQVTVNKDEYFFEPIGTVKAQAHY
jgi:hypothetical protein